MWSQCNTVVIVWSLTMKEKKPTGTRCWSVGRKRPVSRPTVVGGRVLYNIQHVGGHVEGGYSMGYIFYVFF